MSTRDEIFPSKWLKASDVEPPVVATVDAYRREMVGQGADAKSEPILYFQGAIKPLILNRTNWDSMVSLSGRENSDDWSDVVVELYAVDVMVQSRQTRGVRIRRPKARARKAPAATAPSAIPLGDPTFEEPSDDEVGF